MVLYDWDKELKNDKRGFDGGFLEQNCIQTKRQICEFTFLQIAFV